MKYRIIHNYYEFNLINAMIELDSNILLYAALKRTIWVKYNVCIV